MRRRDDRRPEAALASCWPRWRRRPGLCPHRRRVAPRRGGARRREGAPDGGQRQHRGGGRRFAVRRRRRPDLRPVLPGFLRNRAAPEGRLAQPRFRGDRRPAGLHSHQRARRRPRLAHQRDPRRRAHLSGEARRHRPRPRPGGDQGRREGAVRRRRNRRLGPPAHRRAGDRDRQPLRPDPHRDHRGRQRHPPLDPHRAGARLLRLRPDRRGDQPRQQRRPAAGHHGQDDRRQHRGLQRGDGDRLRHPRGGRAPGRRGPGALRPGAGGLGRPRGRGRARGGARRRRAPARRAAGAADRRRAGRRLARVSRRATWSSRSAAAAVRSAGEFHYQVGRHAPGETVALTVRRGREQIDLAARRSSSRPRSPGRSPGSGSDSR